MKLKHFLTPYTIINSKWIKVINVWAEILNIGRILFDINHSKILFNPSPSLVETKAKKKKSKWVLVKLKSFYRAKETIKKVKRQPSEWEKITANETTDKGLSLEYIRSSCS